MGWLKKKRFYIPLGAIVFIIAVASAQSPSQTPTPTQQLIQTPAAQKVEAPTVPTASPFSSADELSNDNYYTNVEGNEVHSPAYSSGVPAGASALCGDGTYSFSQNRRGTCSHHGGVSEWLY